MEQDFYANFQVNVTWFLPFSPLSLTESCSFWYGWKDLFTLLKLADKLSLTIKRQVVEEMLIYRNSYGRFRGKRVKLLNLRTTGHSVYRRSALSDVTVTNLAILLFER